jgi:hypothetical protein
VATARRLMQITTIYRTFDGDNKKPRPPYYSKLLSFQSFLLSWRKLSHPRRLIMSLNTPRMPAEFTRLMDKYADEVRYVEKRGNASTFRAAIDWVQDMPKDGLVYMSEDDYLYMPEALPELMLAAEAFPDVEYFTLYDHLDRYTRTDDLRFGRREFIRVSGARHWKVVESTCSTFAARVSALQGLDGFLKRSFCVTGRTWDRTAWRLVQGIGPLFFWKWPKRRLVEPLPSLATHLDPPYLAPLVDWAALAARTADEARDL